VDAACTAYTTATEAKAKLDAEKIAAKEGWTGTATRYRAV